jgi:hypothetical protein
MNELIYDLGHMGISFELNSGKIMADIWELVQLQIDDQFGPDTKIFSPQSPMVVWIFQSRPSFSNLLTQDFNFYRRGLTFLYLIPEKIRDSLI